MDKKYDVVIIGSGLGGLVCANILAREGYSVCVLEKNKQYGGCLQTFVRDKNIFDTGVHYIGGLSEGQNLYRYLDYLGIIQDLKLRKLDEDGFDVISFDDDPVEYRHAQGYENFINTLLQYFPDEEKGIRLYCKKLKQTCNDFPLYNLNAGLDYMYNAEMFRLKAKDYIASITKNKKLRAVLAGNNFLYAGDANLTPFYVHALSVNSYIQSSYRCVHGGSQISKLLIRKLKQHGGEIYKRSEVIGFDFENKTPVAVNTKSGKKVKGTIFISNIEPKRTLKIVGDERFRKAYVNRIKSIESIISAFSIYLVLKPETIRYQNKNFYHIRNSDRIWDAQDYTEKTWPEGYMISMGAPADDSLWANNLTAITYMKYDEVSQWENTFNTVAEKGERGITYDEFKTKKTELLLKQIERKIPNIRSAIQSVYTSTPLSYRDYIGSERGGIYGYIKDANNPLKSFVSAKTRIKNLYFTGQCLNMHGILGVTIGAVLTCSEILGREYLMKKILKSFEKTKVS